MRCDIPLHQNKQEDKKKTKLRQCDKHECLGTDETKKKVLKFRSISLHRQKFCGIVEIQTIIYKNYNIYIVIINI